jgi:hypothetical protein
VTTARYVALSYRLQSPISIRFGSTVFAAYGMLLNPEKKSCLSTFCRPPCNLIGNSEIVPWPLSVNVRAGPFGMNACSVRCALFAGSTTT